MIRPRLRFVLRWALILLFALAGALHVAWPAPFLRIVPGWVPWPEQVVIATGWCELAGAAGLAMPRLRQVAGPMLALYAVCVWPANMKHALDYAAGHGAGPGWLYHGPRLLFQPAIVWACLFAGGLVDWPFKARSPTARRRRDRDRPQGRRA